MNKQVEVERFIREKFGPRAAIGRFDFFFARAVQQARLAVGDPRGGASREGALYRESVLLEPEHQLAFMGAKMDNVIQLTQAATAEVKESKAALEEMRNQVFALTDVILPALLEMTKSIRNARMTALGEIRQVTESLKDVRALLSDKEHDAEIARLERLVALCSALREFKADGTLDALCDSALRLACGENQKAGR